jgi:hypothetical protein
MCFGLWFEMEWIWSGFARVFGGNAGGGGKERGKGGGAGLCAWHDYLWIFLFLRSCLAGSVFRQV